MDKCFVLHLIDYSTPAAITLEKLYFGDENNLTEYLNNGKCENRALSIDVSTLDTFLKDTTQKIAYESHKLGETALLFGDEHVVLPAKEWTHLNTWGFPYEMCFDKCEVSVLWLRFKGKYYRCIKPKFTSLSYYSDAIEEYKIIKSFWGQPGYFKLTNNICEAALYVVEKEFEKNLEMMEDMNTFYAPDIDFCRVIDEVFGDG